MLERTKKLPTDPVVLAFEVPQALVQEVHAFMRQHGIQAYSPQSSVSLPEVEDDKTYSIENAFPYTPQQAAAACLRGARLQKELTQAQLAEQTGITRRTISEYENCHHSKLNGGGRWCFAAASDQGMVAM